MSAVMDCPICARALQVSDNLHGETVRCPTCGHTFNAIPPGNGEPVAPATAHEAPVPVEILRPLEIGDHQVIPRMPVLRPTLVGEERGIPRPSTAPAPTQRPLDDFYCPSCGERAVRRARHCARCGESLLDPEDGPWPRYDCEPHRAGLIMGLGIGSVVLATTCFLSFVGLPLGIAAVVMGRGDMKKMQAGTMDPDGRSSVNAGVICGIVGIVLNAVLLSFIVLDFLWLHRGSVLPF
jgi:predicted Zn finger-like uncharacterized protein